MIRQGARDRIGSAMIVPTQHGPPQARERAEPFLGVPVAAQAVEWAGLPVNLTPAPDRKRASLQGPAAFSQGGGG